MRNPEEEFTNSQEGFLPRTEEERILKEAYIKASQLDLDEINPDDFVGRFHKDDVERDKRYVERKKEEFASGSREEKEAKALAEVFEAILIQQVELNDWMGEGVVTKRASEYDDIAHQVDAIAEIILSDSKTHLALAIDVTYGKFLDEKFEEIKKEIEKGTLTTVRYYEETDQDGNIVRDSKFKVPRVVVGIDRDSLIGLVELWNKGDNDKMRRHYIQLAVLDEMRIQLKRFIAYAESLDDREEIAEIYKKQLEIVEGIRLQKQELYDEADPNNLETGYRANDKTYRAILANAKKFEEYAKED